MKSADWPRTMSLPTTQTAAVVNSLGGPVEFRDDYPVPKLKENEVLVKVLYVGVCQSDLHTKNGTASGPDGQAITKIKLPHVGGHEGVGTIAAMHDSINTDDQHIQLNRYVGIRFLSRICRRCNHCLAAQEQYCSSATNHLHHEDGAFQEYVALDADNLTLLPDDIDPVTTGPTLCAGVTAYKVRSPPVGIINLLTSLAQAVLNANVKPGDHVVVIGAAGGLGHFAVQYAAAHSAHIIAIDTGASKRDFLASIGCNTYIDILTLAPADVVTKVHDLTRDHTLSTDKSKSTSGAHAVIVTAGNSEAYETAAELLRTGGGMSCVGISPPGKMPEFPIAKIVIKGLRIYGNLVGNMKETLEAVDFVRRGVVKPHIVARPWRELEAIYEEMEKGEIMGRVIIAIWGEVPAANGLEKEVRSKKRKIDD